MHNKSNGIIKNNLIAYGFIGSFLILYLVFNFYALLKGVYISFCEWDITGDMVPIGFSNYINLFKDELFWDSIWNTTRYVIISTPIFMVISFLIAYLIESKFIKRKQFFRAVFFIPNILAVSIVAVIWRYTLQPYTGLLNSTLHIFGYKPEILWLQDNVLVWIAIVMLTMWWRVGYYMILYIAGLQDIPNELYEASSIEGANEWQQIRYMVLPYLKPTHVLVLFLQMIESFKIFGQVYLITNGGPGGASRTLIQYIYDTGFNRYNMGYASAAAVILFILIIGVSIPIFKQLNKSNV